MLSNSTDITTYITCLVHFGRRKLNPVNDNEGRT